MPLGYKVKNRKAVVIKSEAEHVRTTFRRYLELGQSIRCWKTFTSARSSPKFGPYRPVGPLAAFRLLYLALHDCVRDFENPAECVVEDAV